jgi:hypothetical protein
MMTTDDLPVHAALRGRIAYRDGTGAEVGRERFEILRHAAGYSLRALCEMDDIGLIRDVTLALDPQWRPLDGFCRITQQGRTASATWIDVAADRVTLAGRVRDGDGTRAIDGTIARSTPLPYLGLHPLQGDALIVECWPDAPAGQFVPIDTVTNSHSPDGEEDVGLRSLHIDLAFIGHETIEVAAGRFAARRFSIRWREDWPAADLWVRDTDCLFLLMRWSLIDRWYELAELEE